jgi:SAM-dependent methyltransferase
MVELAQRRAPSADIRVGDAEHLPWENDSFDVVTAINALQFADDTLSALAEFARVAVVGGVVAIANWAEGPRNDLDVIERAVAAADDGEVPPDGDLRQEGGLERVLSDAGLAVIGSDLVETPWVLPDVAALVRAILGQDRATVDRLGDVVVQAARPFRTEAGGYLLRNAFRFAAARTS